MKNLEKYLSLLNDEVNGLLLTSRYSRHYGAEYDIAEGVAIVSKKAAGISPIAAILKPPKRVSKALKC